MSPGSASWKRPGSPMWRWCRSARTSKSGSSPGRRRDSCPLFARHDPAFRLPFAGVPEVHQFPDRVVLVGLGQLTIEIPRDLDVTGESQVGTILVRQLGGDALDALDAVGHPGCRQIVAA